MDKVYQGNYPKNRILVNPVRFEILTAVPIKIAVF